jgi:hypothetical protein
VTLLFFPPGRAKIVWWWGPPFGTQGLRDSGPADSIKQIPTSVEWGAARPVGLAVARDLRVRELFLTHGIAV